MNRIAKLLLGALLLLPTVSFADPSITGPIVVMQTDGTQTDGAANIITNNAGPIRFYTNKTLRGYIDGTTGAMTGFSFSAPNLANNSYLTATNAAGNGTLNLLKADATDDTELNSDASDTIKLRIGGDANRLFTFDASSDAAHTLVFGDGGTTATQTLFLGASTADADDDSTTVIGGGGAGLDTRGAFIQLKGNEASGAADINITAGNASGSDIIFSTLGATAFTFSASTNTDMLFGKTNAYLRAGTSDGSDNARLVMSGGGNILDATRGAYLELSGNENTETGDAILSSGNGASGNIYMKTAAGNNLVLSSGGASTFVGTVTSSRTTDLGWAVVDGADNTACNSICTSAAVFGFNLSAGATSPNIVGPADATADICLCAGAS